MQETHETWDRTKREKGRWCNRKEQNAKGPKPPRLKN